MNMAISMRFRDAGWSGKMIAAINAYGFLFFPSACDLDFPARPTFLIFLCFESVASLLLRISFHGHDIHERLFLPAFCFLTFGAFAF